VQPVRRPATYEDLLALPDGVRAEIVAGDIVVAPAPLPRHSKVQRALGGFLGGPYDDGDGHGGPGGWWIFIEVDIRLGANVVRPDLAGWRRERLPEPDVRPIDVVPDWICEILSESNAAYDRVTKRRLYAEHGVRHFWLADPESRTLETYGLDAGRWVDTGSFDESSRARIAPFDAVELEIARIFLPKRV
jgi:Uma2 family endonuclease